MKSNIAIKQGTDAWADFRAKGIGASDAPAVLGECDFKTRFQLWELKTGKREPEATNYAMQRGIDAERKIRALYELRTGIDAEPLLGEHQDYDFMRASFDGFNKEENIIIEFKYPSKEKHLLATRGIVPLTYKAQLQHQLFVSGAKRVDYVSYDGKDIVIVPVEPNLEYMKRLLDECAAFWALVLSDTPPDLSDKDYKTIKDKKAVNLAKLFETVKSNIDSNKKDLERIKEELFKLAKSERFICGPIRAMIKYRRGAVDYKKIPILKGVDLEPYRKKGTVYKEITVKKNGSSD